MNTVMHAPLSKLLYRIEEGGDLIGVKRSKMFDLIARGRISVVKIDGATRIPASELAAFVDRIKAESGLATVA